MQLGKPVNDVSLLFPAKFSMLLVPPIEPFIDKLWNILRWRRNVTSHFTR